MSRKVLYSSLVVSVGMLLGRLMGFVREASIASSFGVSVEADVAVLALTIPDVLVGVLVAGGLSAALIPEFKRLTKKDASALFLQVSGAASSMVLLVVCMLMLYPESLTFMFAPGMAGESVIVAQGILQGVLWLIPVSVLAGVSTAYLHAQEKFLIPAMGTLIFNASVVFGLLVFVKEVADLYLLVYFVILGGLLRWWSQLWALRKHIIAKHAFSKLLLHKDLFRCYWQAVLASSLLMLYPVIARSFASFSGEGGLSMMNYAWRLVEFPLGLVVTILSVVLFPKLANMVAENNNKGFEKVFNNGLLLSLVLAMAIVGPVLASPETFVYMAFGWGEKISSERILAIATLLQVGILILPVQAVIAMAVAAFNARGETYIPAWVSTGGFVLLILLSWRVEPTYGLAGVLGSVLIAYLVVASLLLFALYRRGVVSFGYSLMAYPFATIALSSGLSQISLSLSLDSLARLIFLLLSMLITTTIAMSLLGGKTLSMRFLTK